MPLYLRAVVVYKELPDMFSGKQRFQPLSLTVSINPVLDQFPDGTDRKCSCDQDQNVTDLFSGADKFCFISSEAEISGHHKKYRHCKSCQNVCHISRCAWETNMKKDNSISTDSLDHVQSFISHKNYSFFPNRYTSRPVIFCQEIREASLSPYNRSASRIFLSLVLHFHLDYNLLIHIL